jgi:early secretory antigenic target protein ESAT-6
MARIMSGGVVAAHFESIDASAETAAAIADSIQTTMDDLQSYVAALTAHWSGVAQQNYLYLQRQWNQAAADLHAVLTGISGMLSEASGNYSGTEAAIAGFWA